MLNCTNYRNKFTHLTLNADENIISKSKKNQQKLLPTAKRQFKCIYRETITYCGV